MLRLRQIALVARALEPVETALSRTLGAEVCFRDPGVGKYGLHNALWALGGTFLEVVAPLREGTAAGRYLDRRKGDGGYMVILDCADLEDRRARFLDHGVRLVEDLRVGDDALLAEALHLHPRDTGGCLLSVDRHGPDRSLMGSYRWAGDAWQAQARADIAIAGAVMQCDDPLATATRWSVLLDRPLTRTDDGALEIALDNGWLRFVVPGDERGEGLAEVALDCAPSAPIPADGFDLGGVRFRRTA